MDEELKVLRRDLGRMRKGRGARYPKELKERVVRYGQRQHEAGSTWETIGEALGMGMETVRRWVVDGSKPALPSRGLVPVRVVERQAVSAASSGLAVTGFRVEGLSVDEVARLLRALG